MANKSKYYSVEFSILPELHCDCRRFWTMSCPVTLVDTGSLDEPRPKARSHWASQSEVVLYYELILYNTSRIRRPFSQVKRMGDGAQKQVYLFSSFFVIIWPRASIGGERQRKRGWNGGQRSLSVAVVEGTKVPLVGASDLAAGSRNVHICTQRYVYPHIFAYIACGNADPLLHEGYAIYRCFLHAQHAAPTRDGRYTRHMYIRQRKSAQ